MLELELDARTVGNTVFGFSPMAELGASLCRLTRPSGTSVHDPWLAAVQPRLHEVTDDLLRALMGGDPRWVPDFLFPAVTGRRTIDDQLEVISACDAPQLVADLAEPWPDLDWPSSIGRLLDHGPDAGSVLASALRRYWDEAVAPYWPRIVIALEDDVTYRAAHLLSDGLFGALGGLDVAIAMSEELLTIDLPGPDYRYRDASFVLVPSVFSYPGCVVTHQVEGTFQITYGARGAARVWENVRRTPTPGHVPLEALLGANRARILVSLAVPSSTTQLAGDLHQPPSVVSRHLRILHESGLVARQRSGRSVLYRQSPLAVSLVQANETR